MPKHKKMSLAEKKRAFLMLQGVMEEGALPHGAIQKIAVKFGVTRGAISQLWKRCGGARVAALNKSPDALKPSHRPLRAPKYDPIEIKARVEELELNDRQTFRDLSHNLKMPLSTIYRLTAANGKENGFRRHSSSLKPTLTSPNKVERVFFALDRIPEGIGSGSKEHDLQMWLLCLVFLSGSGLLSIMM